MSYDLGVQQCKIYDIPLSGYVKMSYDLGVQQCKI